MGGTPHAAAAGARRGLARGGQLSDTSAVERSDRRKGYRYSGFVFADDGRLAKGGGVEYSERDFPPAARRKFHLWLVSVLFVIFPGIPLLAYAGVGGWWLLGAAVPWLVIAHFLHARIHRCPGCGGSSRVVRTPHHGAPVLYMCARCRTFCEHGHIDGGWPWK